MPKFRVCFGRHISEPDYDYEENYVGSFEYDELSKEYEVGDIRLSELETLLKDDEDDISYYEYVIIDKLEE